MNLVYALRCVLKSERIGWAEVSAFIVVVQWAETWVVAVPDLGLVTYACAPCTVFVKTCESGWRTGSKEYRVNTRENREKRQSAVHNTTVALIILSWPERQLPVEVFSSAQTVLNNSSASGFGSAIHMPSDFVSTARWKKYQRMKYTHIKGGGEVLQQYRVPLTARRYVRCSCTPYGDLLYILKKT